MAAQFFQRVAQYLANEVITKRLAQSSTFLKAAHKTHDTISKSAHRTNTWLSDAKQAIERNPELKPAWKELNAAKDKLKQALAKDQAASSSPLSKPMIKRR